MTAEKVLEDTFDLYKYRMASPPYHQAEEAVLDAMNEFAKLKCQELLSLVAEKAKIKRKTKSLVDGYLKITNQKDDELEAIRIFYSVDKESIINCVDLDEFIKN